MASTKIYTKTGDKGQTGLLGGTRVSKADSRLEAYGALDELNAHLGRLCAVMRRDQGRAQAQLQLLIDIQADLFVIGSHLACEKVEYRKNLAMLSMQRVADMEKQMDQMSQELPALKNFILPGGHEWAAEAHLCRTVCRRAERHCVALHDSLGTQSPVQNDFVVYINRLSDYFFVLARYFNHLFGQPEQTWRP